MKSFVFIVFLLIVEVATAQISIKGYIKDKDDASSVAYVSIILKSKSDSLSDAYYTISDSLGYFTIEDLDIGSYILETQHLSYVKIYKHLGLKKDTIINLSLEKNVVLLEEIAILSKRDFKDKIEVAPDKITLKIDSSLQRGNQLKDLLNKLPFVDYNPIDESLKAFGKNDILVYINDVEIHDVSLKSILKLHAKNIRAIEVKNPGSEIDANGNCFIINIQLIEKVNTLNLSTQHEIGKLTTTDTKINYIYSSKKIDVFLDVFAIQDNNFDSLYNKISIKDTTINERNTMNTKSDMYVDNLGQLSYKFNEKNKLTLQGSFKKLDQNVNANLKSNFINESSKESSNQNISNNLTDYSSTLNYENKLNERLKLNFRSNFYNRNLYRELKYNINTSNDKFQYQVREDNNSLANQLDLEREYTKGVSKIGIKYITNELNNRYNYTFSSISNTIITKLLRDTILGFNEEILALYTSNSYKLNEKYSIKAGLRYEYTNQMINDTKRNFQNFFPNLSLAYKSDKKVIYTLTFNSIIIRPTFNQLSGLFFYLDNQSYIQGNILLKPEISHNINLSLKGYENFLFDLEVDYNVRKNPFIEVIEVGKFDNTEINVRKTINAKDEHTINILYEMPFFFLYLGDFSSQFNMGIEGNYHEVIVDQDNEYQQFSFNYDFSASLSYKTWYLDYYVTQISPQYLNIYRIKSRGYQAIQLRKIFNKLELWFSYVDIKYRLPVIGNTVFDSYTYDNYSGQDTRRVRFGFNYYFGFKKKNKAEKINIDNDRYSDMFK